ncbi:MAG: helix-turn-helix domain-containing protein [Rhodopila sp.]|jgi:hypothetical protein
MNTINDTSKFAAPSRNGRFSLGKERDMQVNSPPPTASAGNFGMRPNDRITASIPDACRISGLSRSEIYRRLAVGDIHAVKNGSRTLILLDSLRAYLASLPAATFRAPRAA